MMARPSRRSRYRAVPTCLPDLGAYEFSLDVATFRRKIDVSGIEVSWLPQNKTRRGERRARVGLD